MGNSGVAAAADYRNDSRRQRASAPAASGGRTYIVAEGDSLFDIARSELGKASRWVEIYDLNADVLGKDIDIFDARHSNRSAGRQCAKGRSAVAISIDGIPEVEMTLKKIISGGQTGVDRGALDAAIALGMEHGGWCPQGRQAEDGRIPDCYRLEETDSPDYPVRTERNVLEATPR